MTDETIWPFGEGSEFEENLGKFARLLRCLFDALKDAGFTESQAFELIKDFLRSSLAAAKGV